MTVTIEPLAARYFGELHSVLDFVAREGRYLSFLQAPAQPQAFAFFQRILDRGSPHFVALSAGRVVGFCDVLPARGEARAHVGVLGTGLLPEFRGQGAGASLMAVAVAGAWEKGLTRIELSVRTDNTRARRLYERLGFEIEGRNRRAFCVDGQYVDAFCMGPLRS